MYLLHITMTGTRWLVNPHLSQSLSAKDEVPEDPPVVKQNPLFHDEEDEVIKALPSPRVIYADDRLNMSWNPLYVADITIAGTKRPLLSGYYFGDPDQNLPTTSGRENDRSLRTISTSPFTKDKVQLDNQSQSSSDIDEEMFTMEDIPPPPQPILPTHRVYTHPIHVVPDGMIKELSEKLASSRERCLLTSTLAKTDRYNSVRGQIMPQGGYFQPFPASSQQNYYTNGEAANFPGELTLMDFGLNNGSQLPFTKFKDQVGHYNSNRRIKSEMAGPRNPSAPQPPSRHSSMMLPVLKELDRILASSRTMNTFKTKVHQATEQMTDASSDGTTNSLQTVRTDGDPQSSSQSRFTKFMRRRRRTCQVMVAAVLLILFLAMLVTLSVCCSNRKET